MRLPLGIEPCPFLLRGVYLLYYEYGGIVLMKQNIRLRELAFFLAMCGGVFCACFCVLSVANDRHSALYRVDMHKSELRGWEACRETKPALFRENEGVVSRCAKSLAEAEGSFWVKLSPRQLVGLYVLGGLGGALGGYLAVWVVGRCLGLAVCGLAGLAAAGSRRKTPDGPMSALYQSAGPANVDLGEKSPGRNERERSKIAVREPLECH